MNWFPAQLREINTLAVLLRIALCLAIGGILGFERGRMSRPAGFRTYIIVCLGAMIVMLTNQYAYQNFQDVDPTRLGAQVVSGIGFLGAGTILVTNQNQVKGMTTAAGMWAGAGCGLAIGIGFYEGAILGGISILFVLTILRFGNDILRRLTRYHEVYIEYTLETSLGDILSAIRKKNYKLSEVDVHQPNSKGYNYCKLVIKTPKHMPHHEMTEILETIPGVHFVEDLSE